MVIKTAPGLFFILSFLHSMVKGDRLKFYLNFERKNDTFDVVLEVNNEILWKIFMVRESEIGRR